MRIPSPLVEVKYFPVLTVRAAGVSLGAAGCADSLSPGLVWETARPSEVVSSTVASVFFSVFEPFWLPVQAVRAAVRINAVIIIVFFNMNSSCQ